MGDIGDQLAIKERLKCKSFDWFMKEVAYDVFDKYPPLPPNKLWGELRNVANNFCLDTQGKHPPEKVGIGKYICSRKEVIKTTKKPNLYTHQTH